MHGDTFACGENPDNRFAGKRVTAPRNIDRNAGVTTFNFQQWRTIRQEMFVAPARRPRNFTAARQIRVYFFQNKLWFDTPLTNMCI